MLRAVVTTIHGPHHPYNSYSLLGPAFSQPFLAKKYYFRTQRFRPETAKERLYLTSYNLYALYGCRWPWATMSYGPQNLYSSYSSLSLVVPRPFLVGKALYSAAVAEGPRCGGQMGVPIAKTDVFK